jgi:hypothetical protein
MKQEYSRRVQKALKHVHETYRFLFEQGYQVFSAEDIPMGWQVVLRKQDLFINIQETREEEELYFRRGAPPPDEFTDIGTVIYAATGEKIPRWESSSPKVLEQYLDRIETYFEGEYARNKDSLRAAQEEYYAAFSQGGVVAPPVVAPPESKAIPILQYPLIGFILLLILGGLITLCMVLANRLFAAL